MKIIKKICYNYQAEQYPSLSTVRALVKAFTFKQTDMMSDIEWSEEFDNTITAAEACGASFQFPGVVSYVLEMDHSSLTYDQLDPAKQADVMAKAKTLALSTLYMENSNRNHYGVINQKLENDYLVGQDNYPKDLSDAQKLLLNYKNDPKLSRSTTGNDGIAFAQQGQPGQQREPDKSRITCYRCGKKGHYTYDNVCKQVDIDAHRKERDGITEAKPAAKTEPEAPTTATNQASAQMFNLGMMESFDDEPYQLMFCTMGEEHKTAFAHRGANKKKADINYNNVLSQAKGKIDKDWLLLDNQSTVNVICNPALLTNIRQIKQCMYIYCNAGMTSTNWVGEFEGYGTVWFHATGIANILSLALTKETHRIAYDSAVDNIFYMYSQDGKRYREFRQSQRGLYYTDMKNSSVVLTINTVKENKTKFSNLDHRRAVKARKFQDIVNVPTRELLRVIDNKLMPNCPVTRDDVKVANAIFGPSIVGLKGKTVRRTEPHVREGEVQSMPPEIMAKYKNVTLGGDVMFVNKIRFFVTISRHIQFGTVEMISDAKAATLVQCIKSVMQAYSKRGFEVKQINMDLQFEPIKGDIEELQIDMNVVSEDEHVPEVERYIRTVKERVRGAQTTLPFPKLPGRMTVELVASCIFWLNVFPKIAGVSATLSPRTIITGNELDYKKHCTLQFGEYVHTHEKGSNSTAIPRSIGAIAMRPTGNAQGGFWFYSLKTGRRINRRRCTPMPMPDEAIDRINTLARRDPAGITFQDRNGIDIPDDDDEDDDDYMPGLTARDDADDSDDDDSDDDDDYDSDDDDSAYDSDDADTASDDLELPDADHNDDNSNDDVDDNTADADLTGVDGEEAGDEADEDVEHEPDNTGHNLRTRKPRNFDHLKTVGYLNNLNALEGKSSRVLETYALVMNALVEYNRDESEFNKYVHEILLSQWGMKQGLKIFGERGVAAVTKELQQLHDRKVIKPMKAHELTDEQRRKALAYLMFLKEKRDGSIKGRGCADGRKQRGWMDKEDTSSPTVSIQALILSCMIDAKEERDTATADIPGAFLQTDDLSGETHLRLDEVMTELLAKIDPDLYNKYIQTDSKGKKFMYAECLKAIYGTLNAALLFWLKLSKDLETWGFVMNPYDWCVMNKVIDGKQCTVLWHVDDIKVSHKDENVVSSVLKQINEEYGKEAPLTVTRGKVHEYLGMTIDFSEKGNVKFTMIDYIQEMLDEQPDNMDVGESVTAAAEHLFTVDEDGTKLNTADSTIFHHMTAKLLFLSKRARPDLQLAVAFLCTRVKDPDTDDWKKLTRVMKYLRATIGLPLILGIDDTGVLRWHVDAAFAVHNDMKSHTGATLTLGRGAANSDSSKQKLNTRSSTESEFVGVDDEMSQVVWTRYFLEAQGYNVKDNIVYQDNQSAIKLAKNGKRSSGKRTRHINIRYFFVTDRIAAKEMNMEYCPTLDMIADYFTKPLQGSQFRRFRNIILGIDETMIPRYNIEAKQMIRDKRERAALLNEQIQISG